MNERTILHVDANNFYASVECMLHPELRGYPIAVCGDVEERHGIVLAKNYAAKAYGVSTGEAIWQAKQKCKDLVIVPPHYDDYMKISKAARDIYCSKSPTVKEGVLHSAIVRAINRFNQENETTYRLLMKASLSDALGIGGSNEEMELLTRRIDTLNAKMMKLINDAVSEGRSIDDNEGEFKEISDEIAQLNSRVSAIKELIANDESAKDRLESINAKVEELKDGITEYDDTIVRQMIECIKVYGDKRIEVIFGGGTSIIEEL